MQAFHRLRNFKNEKKEAQEDLEQDHKAKQGNQLKATESKDEGAKQI